MAKSVDNVNQSPATSADEVMESIHEVMHLFRAQRHRAASGTAQPITHMEAKALGFFFRNPGATQSDLAAHSGRDKSQLARLVAGLRERGLLEATPDEHDRRNMRLRLTPQALEMHREMQQQSRRVARAAVRGLSADESAQLLALLARVRENLTPG